MQVSNDWPMDEPFGGPDFLDCTIYICEHGVEFGCEICSETQPSFKKKSKLQIVGLVFLSPIYLLGIFIFGVVSVFRFLADGGLVGLMIVGWTISGIYHFFFVFIPYIFSFLL
tara:strand:- start:409 stop:747 length:339 start_codon:yes stop_codon:yes gene_type:complete